jgi:ABC-2 type transport system permease protein
VRLVLLHAKITALELVRYPTFSIPTVLFPALTFLFFVVPRVEPQDANVLMASYAAFGFLAVAFFEFGVGTAAERVSPWDRYMRTLPVTVRVRFAARIVAALAFAGASGLVVVALALALTPAGLPAQRWLALAAALVAGAIPFGLLGIALGYLSTPKGALPIANLLFFTLGFLGGLFTGPAGVPQAIEPFSDALPTRQWSALLEWSIDLGPPRPWLWLGLAGWATAFGLVAAWAYRRDEGMRYR